MWPWFRFHGGSYVGVICSTLVLPLLNHALSSVRRVGGSVQLRRDRPQVRGTGKARQQFRMVTGSGVMVVPKRRVRQLSIARSAAV